MKKWSIRIFIIVCLITFVVSATSFSLIWLSLPKTNGNVLISGPKDTISIIRDRKGIPHIHASSEDDAYFALGYVHAQDRLFQMEYMRRLGSGRLSEILGSRTIESDKFMRTLGLYRHAKENIKTLNPETRNILQKYADGVNAWLENRKIPLPFEFQILQFSPEPWKPEDSMVWQKIMGMILSGNWRDELLRNALLQQLSPADIIDLWPKTNSYSTTKLNTNNISLNKNIIINMIEQIDKNAKPTLASNAWVINGEYSSTKKPIVASDPHLGFQSPIIWYLVRLEWLDQLRVGVTTPGVPFTIIGHNGNTSWGITTTHADINDLFIERSETNKKYSTPIGEEEFIEIKENVKVRFNKPIEMKIRYTRHGPIISDLPFLNNRKKKNNTILALSSVVLSDLDLTANAIYKLNKSNNVTEIKEALSEFHVPQQNFMYADTSGSIGFSTAGKIPIRSKGNGTVPVPGWNGQYDWNGWVPYEKLPHINNPESGYIINANNNPTDPSYPYLISADFPEDFRAKRIDSLINQMKKNKISPDQMSTIQLDHSSLIPNFLLPSIIKNIDTLHEQSFQALQMLKNWDGNMDRMKPEPLIFLTWIEFIKEGILLDELESNYYSFRGIRPILLYQIVNNDQKWCDNTKTERIETCNEIITTALENSLNWISNHPNTNSKNLKEWRWGDFHKAVFENAILKFIPILSHLSKIEIATDGSEHTINRGGYYFSKNEKPFEHTHGSGLRAVFDLNALNNSKFIIALGQSSNFLSKNYSNMNKQWRDGESIMMPSINEEDHEEILRLIPKNIRH